MKYFTKQWYNNMQILPQCFYEVSIGNKNAEILGEELEIQIEETEDNYWTHYKQIESRLPEHIKNIYMHDCKVINSNFVSKDFYMDIDSSGGFRDVSKLIFVNAEILESDIDSNKENWWIYDEIYLYQDRKDRFEMHILFAVENETQNCGLAEMIIVFDDIIIDGN